MIIRKTLSFFTLLICVSPSLCTPPLSEQFAHKGYVEIVDTYHSMATFDALYACFDEFIEFLQENPAWK